MFPRFWLFRFVAFSALCAVQLHAATPSVFRVEPPSWWARHSYNPVRLMFTGTNLGNARVAAPEGFAISNVIVSANGNYVFGDLFIPGDAVPGARDLVVKTSDGEAKASFTIAPPMARSARPTGFNSEDVIYLAMPDRFSNGDSTNDDPAQSRGMHDRSKRRDYHGGDFQGVIDRLPYLRDLGVTALWLTPWYDNVNHFNTKETYNASNQRSAHGIASTDYHGYGAVDFYGVEEHFGDLTKLRELSAAVRGRGMKFVQDQVANHTGPYHPWVENPPTPTWFNGSAAHHLDNSWQIWTVATPNPPQDLLKSTLEGWFINILPDLNQNDAETAAYLIQNSLWWVGTVGIDVVRQDTLPYVPRAYWSRWTSALKREFPDLTILGEMWDGKPELVAFFQGGRKQFDSVDSGVETLFDFPLHFAIRDVFIKGQSFSRLAQVIAADTNYLDASRLVTFLGSHDTSRFMGEAGADADGLKLAFTYLLTARGTPLIYYGDEIAMRGGEDPDNRRDFPGGWAEDKRNAFEPSGRTREEQNVFAHVRKLLALRRELEPLRRGHMVNLASGPRTGSFLRQTEDDAVLVAFNNGNGPETLRIKLPDALATTAPWFNRLTDQPATVSEGVLEIRLPAKTAAILTRQPALLTGEKGKAQAHSGFLYP